VYFVPAQALVTVQAGVMQEAPAGAIPYFEIVDVRTNLLDDSYAFMTEHHVVGLVVLVGATKPCMSDLEEYFVGFQVVPVQLGLDYLALLRTFVNSDI
jgi:hypothetical protein